MCSLGRCSRFWRELCGSDCVWECLYRERWPALDLGKDSSAQDVKTHQFDPQIEPSLMVNAQLYFLSRLFFPFLGSVSCMVLVVVKKQNF